MEQNVEKWGGMGYYGHFKVIENSAIG